ncbi:MAG TPA: NADH-quinone oxidoreductase subunit J [Pyrinomonadaceae bacterium]|jgi:NADH-quinone oxidoreductase subunit J|nr:NADH-quinone oxidoreductase subunit J [Pyrinomonadaceae bacterium]
MILSGWEAVFFWVFAVATLVTALLTILARNAVHSALFLISSLIAVAALFIMLGAEFIAGVQILVYIGGVMVLFLFVIMLVNVGAEERGREAIFNKGPQVWASAVIAVLLAFGLVSALGKGMRGLRSQDRESVERRLDQQKALPVAATGTMKITKETERVGSSLYRYASLPFEIASVLLLVAIIGSVMLARTIKQEAAVDDVDPEVLEQAGPSGTERTKLEAISK